MKENYLLSFTLYGKNLYLWSHFLGSIELTRKISKRSWWLYQDLLPPPVVIALPI